ncbi:Cvm1p Ecym_5623 [Eremothecium cymbalariae DBVPG|uniref:Uncharacterized protein n=1 Tax=Eremothecium cymbalariae (strain CBS 270.75 / DBVPG 7215 / KCTC 17166 / NRRL Y-17582) TaxID=931890 RepID=I6NE67_ERECY|nr:hypothetical protein Ecym_5623 [Eremothecium cymbalariae DBVPG\
MSNNLETETSLIKDQNLSEVGALREQEGNISRRWFMWFGAKNVLSVDEEAPVNEDPVESATLSHQKQQSFIKNISSWIPYYYCHPEEDFSIDKSTEYYQLTAKQIQSLEQEALQAVARGYNSWCWHTEYLPDIGDSTGGWCLIEGELSVACTGSQNCQLPLRCYPLAEKSSSSIYVNNSLLLPGYAPEEYFHHIPWTTKLASTIRRYYNSSRESHLYLKEGTEDNLRDKKIMVISIVGSLPEKYEKIALGSSYSSRYIGKKLAEALQRELPKSISNIAIQTPLDRKPIEDCLKECMDLLCNWRTSFQEYDALFIVGVYHSVPLAIFLIEEIMKHQSLFLVDKKSTIGLLSFNSCLRGYQFWDHSVDTVLEEDANFQYSREKGLFQGASKIQREILSKIKNYGKQDTEESITIKNSMDWLFYNCKSFKMTFISSLHDSFMTISQKLAIDYVHPGIQRHVWCSGEHLNLDLLNLSTSSTFYGLEIPNAPVFKSYLDIPKERMFEIILINNLILTINLGYQEFIPILQLISPYFISRSFNEHTIPANLKKQIQNDQKSWLLAAENKWKNVNLDSDRFLPKEINALSEYLDFLSYSRVKNIEAFDIRDTVYDDNNIYRAFVKNTIYTTLLLEKQHVCISEHTVTPQSIFNGVNQYDLVWKFHECLSKLIKLRNIPEQPKPRLQFSISLDNEFLHDIHESSFARNNRESLRRLNDLWSSYCNWKPQTKGLKQLQDILSVLSLYNTAADLRKDVTR